MFYNAKPWYSGPNGEETWERKYKIHLQIADGAGGQVIEKEATMFLGLYGLITNLKIHTFQF